LPAATCDQRARTGCAWLVDDDRHNSIGITGTCIAAASTAPGSEGNKLVNSASAAAARAGRRSGSRWRLGSIKNGADQCQILSNQISGFELAGIVIGSPAAS